MKYNQKLATICNYLQAIDKNGFYNELYKEYQKEEITLSQALEECKEATINMLEDAPENERLNSILEYINY